MVTAKPYGQLRYRNVNGKRMAYVDEGQATRSSLRTAIRRRRICGAT
jgi:hypothetical protein